MDNRQKFLYLRICEAVTQKDSMSRLMVEPVQAVSPVGSKAHLPRTGCDGDRNQSREACEFTLARKAAKSKEVPVPQTDTGRRGENPKTNERTLVKELGKMTP